MIYDMFGEEGLKTQWEVGARLKTPQELREEFQSQLRLKKEQELDSSVKPRSDIQINIDASQLFNPYDGPSRPVSRRTRLSFSDILSNIEMTQLFLKHSHEVPINDNTQASFVGQMMSRNGVGGGNVVGTLRHTFSPKFWAEIGISVAQPRILSIKGFYAIDTDSFLTVNSQSHTINSPPTINITCGRRLGTNITGYLTYKTGAWTLGPWGKDESSLFARREKSAIAVGLSGGYNKSGYSFELQTGIIQSHISASYNRKLANDYQIRGSTTLSTTNGLIVSIGGDHKVTTNSRVAIYLDFGFPTGLTFKFRFSRLGQKITIPVNISSEFDSGLIFWSTIIPVVTICALDQLILDPRRKKTRAKKLAALRDRHADYITTQKREAAETLRLLRPSVERKIDAERDKDGLIIVEAWYGNIVQQIKEDVPLKDCNYAIDVSIPLQALVNDSQLIIPGGRSKSSIMGFFDPCMGEPKQLKIKYIFKRKLHEITVDDTAPIALPLRSHIIPNDR
ncbi:hypothetical protein G9A89_013781 [Geosiphon pyriformis]|nr:hypothetical protein G9A89_013781 [Geosiphon pyriformis]